MVAAVPDVVFATQSRARQVAVFWEKDFIMVDGCNPSFETLRESLQDFNVSFLNEKQLIDQLNATDIDRLGTTHFDLLVTPSGSCFPKRAWPAILKYLRAGGNWLNVGGVPLLMPSVFVNGEWRIEWPQATYHKRLGITHSFPVDAGGVAGYKAAQAELANGVKATKIYELYVRLSSTSNEPDESGSDGPHEGVVTPLVLTTNKEARPIAAPVIQIDRLQAEFAGGRWVFANFDGKIDHAAIRVLAQRAAQGASRFEVRPDFASYKPGETPTLSVELLRPKGDLQKLTSKMECSITVVDQSDHMVSRLNLIADTENSKATGSVKLDDAAHFAPGFYKVEARTSFNSLTHTSGFWIYDEALLARGKPLTT